MLKWLIGAAAAFGGLVALVYVAQRSLMYFPERLHTPPAMAGFPEAQEVALDTEDGERVIVWHLPPRGEKPVVLYFHGNGLYRETLRAIRVIGGRDLRSLCRPL